MIPTLSVEQKKELLARAVSVWRTHVASLKSARFRVTPSESGHDQVIVFCTEREMTSDYVLVRIGKGTHPEVQTFSLERGENAVPFEKLNPENFAPNASGLVQEEAKRTLNAYDTVRLLGNGEGSFIQGFLDAYLRKLDDPRLRLLLPLSGLRGELEALFHNRGLDAVYDGLNKDAVRIVSYCPEATWGTYAFYAEPGEKGEIRRQAADSYPMLSTVIAQRLSLRRAVDRKESLQAGLRLACGVKPGTEEPLIGKGLLKRLVGLSWPTGGLPSLGVVRHLAQISPDWFPKTPESWNAFCDVSASVLTVMTAVTDNSLDTLLAGCGGNWEDLRFRLGRAYAETRPPEGTTEESFAYFKSVIPWKLLDRERDPDKVCVLIDRTVSDMTVPEGILADDVRAWLTGLYAPACDREALVAACADVRDTIAVFGAKVVAPLAARASMMADIIMSPDRSMILQGVSSNILFSGQSAVSILETSRHIHSQIAALQEAGNPPEDILAGEKARAELNEKLRQATLESSLLRLRDGSELHNKLEEWPAISSIVQAPNGVFCVPLTTKAHLSDEGKYLSHCVGGYSGTCMKGDSIVSFRILPTSGDIFPISLSTVQIGPAVRGKPLDVRQHRARQNKKPDTAAADALEWFLTQSLHNPNFINYDGQKKFLSQQAGLATSLQVMCGYDWTSLSSVEMAVSPWRQRYLPKKLRKLSVPELEQLPEIETLARLFNPAFDRMKAERIQAEADEVGVASMRM